MKHILELKNFTNGKVYHVMNCPSYDRLSQMGRDLGNCGSITVDDVKYITSFGTEWEFGKNFVKIQIGVVPYDENYYQL